VIAGFGEEAAREVASESTG